MKNAEQKAKEIACLLEDGKGKNIALLDISQLNGWTDFFVIATVSSSAHWQGLYKQVKEYAKENSMEMHITNRKLKDGNDWNLLDFGSIVIHLMSEDARTFYDLEKLWHAARFVDFHAD
ncbi:MAG: ribosome silencing factor [Treponema sp.]|nr:ribosome silencing factor [Treponema sp.]